MMDYFCGYSAVNLDSVRFPKAKISWVSAENMEDGSRGSQPESQYP